MSFNIYSPQQDGEYNKYNHLLPSFANVGVPTTAVQPTIVPAAAANQVNSFKTNMTPQLNATQNVYPNQYGVQHKPTRPPPPQAPQQQHISNQPQYEQMKPQQSSAPHHTKAVKQQHYQHTQYQPQPAVQQPGQYQNFQQIPMQNVTAASQLPMKERNYDYRQESQAQPQPQQLYQQQKIASQPMSYNSGPPISPPSHGQQRARAQNNPAPIQQQQQRRPPPPPIQHYPQSQQPQFQVPYPLASPKSLQHKSSSSSLRDSPTAQINQTQHYSNPVSLKNGAPQNLSTPPLNNRAVSMPIGRNPTTAATTTTTNQPVYQNIPTPSSGRTMSLSTSSFRNNSNSNSHSLNNSTNNQQSHSLSKPQVHHTFSLSSKSRSFTSLTKSTLSLSQKRVNSGTALSKVDRSSSQSTLNSQKTILTTSTRRPAVYPALLSRVARLFKDSIVLGINKKDGLEYHDSFNGKQAVDSICKIIRTSDRNLALLLGRSLDAQKVFHDVTYSHRLRDSINEVYAFNNTLTDGFYDHVTDDNQQLSMSVQHQSRHGSYSSEYGQSSATDSTLTDSSSSSGNSVNGVFTILTDCYSPTCTRNKLCYSIACPRRLEQQARLHMKPEGGLKRAESRLSFHENETKNLWHDTVPAKVLESLSKDEKQKQELIYEFIYTERDYVKDLEFMTDFYIIPLRRNDVIPEREREAFIRTVFGGVSDLLQVARPFSDSLTRRQQQQKPVIETIGDLVLQNIPKFEPFIKYGGNKCFASFEHERQQKVNPRYARFLSETEKKPESRRNDLSSFLIKGIQRPAKYQLLLQGIIKYSKEDSSDYKNLVKAQEEVGKLLKTINIQSGIAADRHKIMVLHSLIGKQILEDKFYFKLDYKHKIIYQATLSRKRDNEKIDLYLFEHALLLVKHKIQNKREQYKVFEKPVYLPLLFTNTAMDFPTLRQALQHKLDGSIVSDNGFKPKLDNGKCAINFLSLGNSNIHATLFADDAANQNQVVQQIFTQQKKLIKQNDIFSSTKFETRRFSGNNRINCAVPCYGGKKLLYGTDSGVWVSTVRTISVSTNEKICSDPTLVIDKVNVTQIEVLVEYSKLLILSDKRLFEFDLSCTDSLDHVKNTRTGKEILNHVSFFKTGICDGKLLVCAAKIGSTHSINIFEPGSPFDKKIKNKKYEIREFTFTSDPVSISFLKTKLCIGCTKGFEILSIEKGKKEPILDEADVSLDFATQRESVNPLAIHRLGKEFLLSYSEFSFLINRNGWRTNHSWGIYWEGIPQNIALFYPYLLSFEPGFIEVRDLGTTNLLRAVVGENIRFLHSNEHEALYACEENGYDIIVSIDFLNLKPKSSES